MQITISVIIPTYNAERYLPRLLEKLKKQTVDFELLIIDSSSVDDTIKIAQKYTSRIATIPQSEFDHGGTRTKAAQMTSGEIIVFLTQDALPVDDNAIEKIVSVFDDGTIGAAYGRQIPYKKTSLFGKHLRHFNYPENSHVRSLEDAERSWSLGLYARSIEEALQSYEKAVEKSTDQNAVDNAKNFLVEKFPQFNENQSRRAENQLKGTNNDKETE